VNRLDLGAIAILDALGFKGIWARENTRAVLDRLIALRRTGLDLQGEDCSGVLVNDLGLRHRVRCMSDTIVVTVVVKGPNAPTRALYKAMFSAAMIAGQIMYNALHGTPAFLFRGCIAAGKMKEQADFLIGPAVDEAAERFEVAAGPFLWLAPSALAVHERYEDTFNDRLEPAIMLPYKVPLKNGKKAKTQAFTYFGIINSRDWREALKQRLLTSFGTEPLRPDIKAKKQNAAKFLAHIERIARSGKYMKNRNPTRLPNWEDLSPNQKISLLIKGIHW